MKFLLRVFLMAALASPAFAQSSRYAVDSRLVCSTAIQAALTHPSVSLAQHHLVLGDLRRFYAERDFRPAWHGGKQQDSDGTVALDALEHVDAEGLESAAYRLGAIHLRQSGRSPEACAEFDLLLTAGILDYMRDLHVGRIAPSQVENDIELPSVDFDPVAALSQALAAHTLGQTLASLQPPHREYENLRIGLAHYRELQHRGGWQQFSAMLSPNDQSSLEVLWRRLAIEDRDLGSEPGSPMALVAAIKRYQTRNGLEATGTIGKRTLAALNVPVDQRINQIIANMERWRWLPQFPQQYLEVNTADATLKIVSNGEAVLTSRIVAGKPATPTPLFAAKVSALTVNPYWNIPTSIARSEILPKERRHPGYMAKQHIFTNPNGGLRQQPGPDNALGVLKLEMPNRFDSYLHDTPARNLFTQPDRHFSHGCMRVQQIRPLASWILTGDTVAAKDKLDALVAAGGNRRIALNKPLPVYVLYWTAIADRDGAVEFRSDVYGRDTKLLAALAGQRPGGRLSLNAECQATSAG